MKRKKAKKRSEPTMLVPVTLNLTPEQKEVLTTVASYAGTTLEIVAAVLISTAVYTIKRDTKGALAVP